jgi:plastocyanin
MALAAVVLAGTIGPIAAAGPAGASPAHRDGVDVTVNVSIVDFMFTPKNIQVHVGDTIKWTNNGAATHTSSAKGAVWNSGNIAPGGTFSFTFTTVGTFLYRCNIHPTLMKGGVRVIAGS